MSGSVHVLRDHFKIARGDVDSLSFPCCVIPGQIDSNQHGRLLHDPSRQDAASGRWTYRSGTLRSQNT